MAAHTVNSSTRRSGGAAEIDAGVAGAIAVGCGAEEKLGEGHGAAGDVAADEVRVPGGEVLRVAGAAGEDGVLEAGSVASRFALR